MAGTLDWFTITLRERHGEYVSAGSALDQRLVHNYIKGTTWRICQRRERVKPTIGSQLH
jgi:hypothetical protein